jgi:hypothetical protein
MPEVFNKLTSFIINAVGDGEKITFSTSNNHHFKSGMMVTVTGINPSTYNVKNVVIQNIPSETSFVVYSNTCCGYLSGGVAVASYYNKFSGVKFALDTKTPTKIVSDLPLYDISTGLKLSDVNENTLYTEEFGPYEGSFNSQSATPVTLNIKKDNFLKIEEQFRESTPVSTTLLGVERSETQLGLFSDVSVYGLDRNIWEYFQFTGGPPQIEDWAFKRNPKYGKHYWNILKETPEEQALSLQIFPSNYTFPYNSNFESNNIYDANLYARYRNFIKLGNYLYDYYNNKPGFVNKKFAIDNFLPSSMVADALNIDYGSDPFVIETNMAQIERWTLAWMAMRDGTLFDPDELQVLFPNSDETGRVYPTNVADIDSTNSAPGYSASSILYYQHLESKKSYRYQPGRISGFTFGFRAETDPTSLDNVLEWGCCNDTDEYVFQIRGSQFNIIRRSTIPLPESNLNTMGLTLDDQTIVEPLNPLKRQTQLTATGSEKTASILYETVISRDKFNNDPLNGNGPSGYIVSLSQVTMYKIEFSWYGAIGAKFYAYIPSGNGDARWVLLHTIVIENQLGEPCLQDPYFKFRYTMLVNNTSSIKYPIKMYKYGASYYIDGGDEGTVSTYSYDSNIINSGLNISRSMLGVVPKEFIKNKDGVETKNKKDIIPTMFSATTDKAVRIDVLTCEACPGYGHHYSPSLHANTLNSIVSNFRITSETGATIYYENGTLFTTADTNKKLIGDGLYSSYIRYNNDDAAEALIGRRTDLSKAINSVANNLSNYSTISLVKYSNNFVGPIKGTLLQNVRLSGYELVASNTALNRNNISIKFLNPEARDGESFAEFFIGVTKQVPTKDQATNQLLFDSANTYVGNNVWLENNVLYGEYTQLSEEKDTNGFEYSEWDPRYGNVFSKEPNLPYPPGSDSGYCSEVNVEVKELEFDCTYTNVNPATGVGSGNFLVFTNSEIEQLTKLNGGEFGVLSGPIFVSSGLTFTADSATKFVVDLETKYFITISGSTSTTKIAVRNVRLFGRYVNVSKVFSFSVFPLYVVVGLRDNAKINNITFEEYDNVNKFTYTPYWITTNNSKVAVINSGTKDENGNYLGKDRLNPITGLYEMGGTADMSTPAANYTSNKRLDSATIDRELQQPLRPSEKRTSIFLADSETKKIDLDYMFGQDRYTISPGSFNSKATFFNVVSLEDNAEAQISITTKEQ